MRRHGVHTPYQNQLTLLLIAADVVIIKNNVCSPFSISVYVDINRLKLSPHSVILQKPYSLIFFMKMLFYIESISKNNNYL